MTNEQVAEVVLVAIIVPGVAMAIWDVYTIYRPYVIARKKTREET